MSLFPAPRCVTTAGTPTSSTLHAAPPGASNQPSRCASVSTQRPTSGVVSQFASGQSRSTTPILSTTTTPIQLYQTRSPLLVAREHVGNGIAGGGSSSSSSSHAGGARLHSATLYQNTSASAMTSTTVGGHGATAGTSLQQPPGAGGVSVKIPTPTTTTQPRLLGTTTPAINVVPFAATSATAGGLAGHPIGTAGAGAGAGGTITSTTSSLNFQPGALVSAALGGGAGTTNNYLTTGGGVVPRSTTNSASSSSASRQLQPKMNKQERQKLREQNWWWMEQVKTKSTTNSNEDHGPAAFPDSSGFQQHQQPQILADTSSSCTSATSGVNHFALAQLKNIGAMVEKASSLVIQQSAQILQKQEVLYPPLNEKDHDSSVVSQLKRDSQSSGDGDENTSSRTTDQVLDQEQRRNSGSSSFSTGMTNNNSKALLQLPTKIPSPLKQRPRNNSNAHSLMFQPKQRTRANTADSDELKPSKLRTPRVEVRKNVLNGGGGTSKQGQNTTGLQSKSTTVEEDSATATAAGYKNIQTSSLHSASNSVSISLVEPPMHNSIASSCGPSNNSSLVGASNSMHTRFGNRFTPANLSTATNSSSFGVVGQLPTGLSADAAGGGAASSIGTTEHQYNSVLQNQHEKLQEKYNQLKQLAFSRKRELKEQKKKFESFSNWRLVITRDKDISSRFGLGSTNEIEQEGGVRIETSKHVLVLSTSSSSCSKSGAGAAGNNARSRNSAGSKKQLLIVQR
ncbi:unnamed protein product [Amoebophrya sp. A120]|nr:unnamed protein product [Amoebophrya sp. A120]|eukprot:GSA120T00013342001.1